MKVLDTVTAKTHFCPIESKIPSLIVRDLCGKIKPRESATLLSADGVVLQKQNKQIKRRIL